MRAQLRLGAADRELWVVSADDVGDAAAAVVSGLATPYGEHA
jgi:hypothetical protein